MNSNNSEQSDVKNPKLIYQKNLTTGDLFNVMWTYTVKHNPKYEEIDNDGFRHAILGCSNTEAQEKIYQYYLNLKK